MRGEEKVLNGESEHCFLDQNFKPLRIDQQTLNCLESNLIEK